MKQAKRKNQTQNNDPLVRIRLPQSSTMVRRVSYITSFTAVAGVYTGAVSASTIRANATEWSNLAARYTEYRLLKVKAHFDISNSTTPGGYIVAGTDRSGSGSAANAAAVWALENPKVFNVDATTAQLATYQAHAIDLEDSNFTSTGSNAVTFQVFIAGAANGTASNTVLVEAWIEFRSPN